MGSQVKTMIFPGSFDPFTLGHMDIAKRARAICDRLVVAVMTNYAKNPFFSPDERIEIVRKSLQDMPDIEVVYAEGLLVELFQKEGACTVVRGIRSESDYRNEAEMLAANKLLYPGFDTILLPCQSTYAYTSSSVVKEVASYGGDISGMIAPCVLDFVQNRIREAKTGSMEGRSS